MNERYNNIDILKLMCSFLVICIHVEFAGIAGEWIKAFARIAVPIFFMITGFFYNTVINDTKREKKQIIKVIWLMIISNFIYFLWNIFICIISPTKQITEYIMSSINLKTLLEFLILNESPFGIHLWYLNALFYVLIIVFILNKFNKLKVGFYLIVPLLILGLSLGAYSNLIFNRNFNYLIPRNFLFVGLPWFFAGLLINDKLLFIKNLFLKRKYLIVIILLFLISFFVVERYLLVVFTSDSDGGQYIASSLISCILFIGALIFKDCSYNNVLSSIGRNGSTFIYISHLIAKDVLAIFVPALLPFFIETYNQIRPIVIFLVLIFVVAIFNRSKKLLSKRIKRKIY